MYTYMYAHIHACTHTCKHSMYTYSPTCLWADTYTSSRAFWSSNVIFVSNTARRYVRLEKGQRNGKPKREMCQQKRSQAKNVAQFECSANPGEDFNGWIYRSTINTHLLSRQKCLILYPGARLQLLLEGISTACGFTNITQARKNILFNARRNILNEQRLLD